MSQPIVVGEYYFHRQEMVAGFKFSPDGKFEFFHSYGAVDRNATGTFSVSGDTLKLKSNKEAGKDFTITQQSKSGKGYTLQFKDPNKYLLRHIRCMFFVGTKMTDAFTDESGEVKVALTSCDKIYVQHALFPDIVTVVKDEKNDNNHFTLSLNASLAEVSFKGIDFTIVDKKTITCLPNYFMELEDIQFIKK